MNNLEMSTFKFINCNGSIEEYPYNNTTYNYFIVGGLEELLNALIETKSEQFIRLS